MREILFRGYNPGTRKWHYGGYCFKKVPYIINDLKKIELVEVDTETIGQYTGFPDKNGKKIFEGDIVSICGSKSFLFVIEWDHHINCYILKCTVNGVQDTACSVIGSPEDVEVIGNIYDNPELLGEREKQ